MEEERGAGAEMGRWWVWVVLGLWWGGNWRNVWAGRRRSLWRFSALLVEE